MTASSSPSPRSSTHPGFHCRPSLEIAGASSLLEADKPRTSNLRRYSGCNKLLRAEMVRLFSASRRPSTLLSRPSSAARAIARHTPPVRPHTTLGYDSSPIAVSTNNHTKCAVDNRNNISWTPGSLCDRLRTLDILGYAVDSPLRRPSTHRTRTQSVFCPMTARPYKPDAPCRAPLQPQDRLHLPRVLRCGVCRCLHARMDVGSSKVHPPGAYCDVARGCSPRLVGAPGRRFEF